MRNDVGVVEVTFAFGCAALAEGQELRQPAIGGAVFGKGEKARAVAQIEAAADDEAEPDLFCGVMGTYDAGEAVAVGDRDRLVTERGGGHHQLVRMRGTAQKREIGGDLQLRVKARHCEAPRGAAAISTRLLRCARNDISGKDAMDKPARRAVSAMQP